MKLFEIATGIATKRLLSGNMLSNIETCGNGCSNFSENLRGRGTKTDRVNSIRITNLSICVLCGIKLHCDADIFKRSARAQSIYREVFERIYLNTFVGLILTSSSG